MIPEGVTTFSGLVKYLVKHHHEGNYHRMAVKLKVSPGLPYFWRDEMVREPTDRTVERICAAYGLDYWEVKDVASGRYAATTSTGPGAPTGAHKPHRKPPGRARSRTAQHADIAAQVAGFDDERATWARPHRPGARPVRITARAA